MSKYKLIYDMEHTIDGIEYDSFECAKEGAFTILDSWMFEANADNTTEEWNYMVYNCCVWVEEYDEESGEWEEIWSPSDQELESIGWVEREE